MGATIEQHALKIVKNKMMQCLLLRLACMNRSHVAQVPVLFRMVCKLAIETVTFTTGMFVQPQPLFL